MARSLTPIFRPIALRVTAMLRRSGYIGRRSNGSQTQGCVAPILEVPRGQVAPQQQTVLGDSRGDGQPARKWPTSAGVFSIEIATTRWSPRAVSPPVSTSQPIVWVNSDGGTSAH